MEDWQHCKNILCVRADNMGDVLLSSPAIAALKTGLNCKITLLTSSVGAGIAHLIPDIDAVIIADLPWVKLDAEPNSEMLLELIPRLKGYGFDGCVIFSVYSQTALPAAMLAYLADIPLRLAYSRENPYHLLTNWVPDAEPYFYIRHQVERDLELVKSIGMQIQEQQLRLKISSGSWHAALEKGKKQGINLGKPFLLLHAGVSEEKRRYPDELWTSAGILLAEELRMPLLFSGSGQEKELTERLASAIGKSARSVAGLFSLEEFAAVIQHSKMLVSVNTATIHIAAAAGKPMVVLYAQSNPQHTPWLVPHKLLQYSVPQEMQSHNQVIKYVNEQYYSQQIAAPAAEEVLAAVKDLLNSHK